MFNGIIYNQGIVKKILISKKGISIFIYSKVPVNKKRIGISISCDGVCLTLVSIKKNILEDYLREAKKNKNLEFNKYGFGKNLNYVNKFVNSISDQHVDLIEIYKSL